VEAVVVVTLAQTALLERAVLERQDSSTLVVGVAVEVRAQRVGVVVPGPLATSSSIKSPNGCNHPLSTG
jgi:hypothetical protein